MEPYTSIYKGEPDCEDKGRIHEWQYEGDGFDIYTTDAGVAICEDQKAYRCRCGAIRVVCTPKVWVPNEAFMKNLLGNTE
jgi:hypothetical protein